MHEMDRTQHLNTCIRVRTVAPTTTLALHHSLPFGSTIEISWKSKFPFENGTQLFEDITEDIKDDRWIASYRLSFYAIDVHDPERKIVNFVRNTRVKIQKGGKKRNEKEKGLNSR